MAKDTTDTYKGKSTDIRQLGTELKVSHVVKGIFQREEDHVRFTAQLIDAATGVVLWSDRYDRLAGEIFAVQSDVADHIANSVGSRESTLEKAAIIGAKRKRPDDLGAYETYLLAQDTMHSDMSDAHMIEGQKLLEKAMAKDPTLARAYVKYAWAFAWQITYEGNAGELMKQMVIYARKGVELDPMDADAHAALGYSLTLTGDLAQGEAQFDEALQLNPNAFDLLATYSCMAHNYGKLERGAESADRAIAVNPNYPTWSIPCLRLGMFMVGRYEDAVRIQSRQPESDWNSDGFVVTAGSLRRSARLTKPRRSPSVVLRSSRAFSPSSVLRSIADGHQQHQRLWPTSCARRVSLPLQQSRTCRYPKPLRLRRVQLRYGNLQNVVPGSPRPARPAGPFALRGGRLWIGANWPAREGGSGGG